MEENNNIERVIEYIDDIIEDSKKYPHDFIGTLLIIKNMLNREIWTALNGCWTVIERFSRKSRTERSK